MYLYTTTGRSRLVRYFMTERLVYFLGKLSLHFGLESGDTFVFSVHAIHHYIDGNIETSARQLLVCAPSIC